MMRVLDGFLYVESQKRSTLHMITWWEVRRPVYNIIIFIFGTITQELSGLFVETNTVTDGYGATLLPYFIIANICYTAGWITEISNKRFDYYGATMFKVGVLFSMVCCSLPLVLNIATWLIG